MCMEKYLKNKYVLGSAALMVACIILALISGIGGNSPEGVVLKLERGINSGNDKKILSCYDSDLSKLYDMGEKLDKNVSLADELGFGDRRVKLLVQSVTMDSDTEAAVSCIEILTEKGGKGESVSLSSLKLNKEGGKWVIQY